MAGIGTVLGGLAGYVTVYRTVADRGASQQLFPESGSDYGSMAILVLPLANQTGDAKRQYIADGLTTAVTADLGRIRDAVVVPPLASVALHERRLSLAELRAQTKVRFVLGGAVVAAGERLRVTVQLSDTVTGRQLWTHVHESGVADLLGLQDELTARVRTSVGPQMLLTAAQELPTGGRPQVVDLILQLRALEMQVLTGQRMRQREALARRVLAHSPDDPRGNAALAAALLHQVISFQPELGIDEGRARGMLAEARRAVVTSLARQPDDVTTLHTKAMLEGEAGEIDAALQTLERARAVDPRAARTLHLIASVHLSDGRTEQAISLLQQALDQPMFLPPVGIYFALGSANTQLGRSAEAVAWHRKSYEAAPDNSGTVVGLARALALDGKVEEARTLAEELRQRFPSYRLQGHRVRSPGPWPGREDEWRSLQERMRAAERAAGLPGAT